MRRYCCGRRHRDVHYPKGRRRHQEQCQSGSQEQHCCQSHPSRSCGMVLNSSVFISIFAFSFHHLLISRSLMTCIKTETFLLGDEHDFTKPLQVPVQSMWMRNVKSPRPAGNIAIHQVHLSAVDETYTLIPQHILYNHHSLILVDNDVSIIIFESALSQCLPNRTIRSGRRLVPKEHSLSSVYQLLMLAF